MSRTATPREVTVSRGVAVLGALAGVLHVPLAVAHAGASLPLAGVLLVMSLVCLPCAGHLWRMPSRRTWAVVAGTGAALLVVHGVLLLAPSAAGAALPATGHAHATALGGPPEVLHSAGALAAVSGLTLAQVATCTALLARRTGSRAAGPRRPREHVRFP